MYQDDLEFLRDHASVITIADRAGAGQVAIIPDWQARVMTSTTGAGADLSQGWINRKLIARGELQPHINPYGGEDRFWLGPEGGRYSIFFRAGDPQDYDHWQTPPLIDIEPFEVARVGEHSARFTCEGRLVNRAGTAFDLGIERAVRVLERDEASDAIGCRIPGEVRMVGYESANTVFNRGKAAWTREGGLLSIWILGMFPPSPTATVVVPFHPGDEAELGPIVNDVYFGRIAADRLAVAPGTVFLRADGRSRGKIGIPPRRALPCLGSYDPIRSVLTVVRFDIPSGAGDYVNALWDDAAEPYTGDVANAYNDGPPPNGGEQLGPFYELESSSPGLALEPGTRHTHHHATFHFEGDEAELAAIAKGALRVDLSEIRGHFPDQTLA